MSFKITNNSLFEKHFMSVDSEGVRFYNGGLFGAKRFRFSEIETVLLSGNHTLSIQVGKEVFSIPTQPGNPKHQNVIDFLLQEARRSAE
jgi:hypothetical protein